MAHPLLNRERIDPLPDAYLRSLGQVFAEYGEQTQDSGNISYGVQIGGERYFVKTAGRPDNPRPYLAHPERIALLHNAVRLHTDCQHPILVPLLHVIESPIGPLLIYPWVDGELLGTPRAQRDDPTSSYQRFRNLPAPTILRCLDAIYDLHHELALKGWNAGDFYDGCLLYDFTSGNIRVMDIDYYHNGAFRNEMGRMFGSTRFMAPEEFEKGALIDQQTTVFVMGRTALLFLSDGTLNADAFRGTPAQTPAQYEVIQRACAPERSHRFATMADFYHAWQAAKTTYNDHA
jgi:serine/threonine protein kinase